MNTSDDQAALVNSDGPLMRLALVERQLVMQMLDFTSLARVMCTSRQLSAEALHPQSGKFIQTLTVFPPNIAQAVHFGPYEPSPMHASALFRAHMPIELRLSTENAADIPGLIELLAPFKRFHELVLWDAGADWTEERALQFLQSPVVQTIRLLWGIRPNSVWLDSLAVQRVILALPLLHKISCDFDRELTVPLDAEALADARMLREATIEVPVRDHRALAQFAAVPQLTNLILLFVGSASDETPPVTVSIPTLTSLSLDVRATAANGDPSWAHLRALLAGFPKLVVLQGEHFHAPESILRSLLALGADKFPALRRLDILSRDKIPAPRRLDSGEGVSVDLLRRFLARFPLVEQVQFRFRTSANGQQAAAMLSTWQHCPRVRIVMPDLVTADAASTNSPPPPVWNDDQPHDSDTEEPARAVQEAEREVEAEEEEEQEEEEA